MTQILTDEERKQLITKADGLAAKSGSIFLSYAELVESAIIAKLVEGQEAVAWQNSRNGFIAKENKNPEYNVPLYTHPSAELKSAQDELAALRAELAQAKADAAAESEDNARLRSEWMAPREADMLLAEVEQLKSKLGE